MNIGYDGKCEELARYFLEDEQDGPVKEGNAERLTQNIQNAVEDFFLSREMNAVPR